jgi:hypothetical protein
VRTGSSGIGDGDARDISHQQYSAGLARTVRVLQDERIAAEVSGAWRGRPVSTSAELADWYERQFQRSEREKAARLEQERRGSG